VLVYTIDDTKGKPSILTNSRGVPYISEIQSTPSSNPVAARLTINGNSLAFGTLPSISTTSSARREVIATATPADQVFFSVAQSFSPNGGANVATTCFSGATPFTTDYRWQTPFSYTGACGSVTGFTYQNGKQDAIGEFGVTSLTVRGP
jgi:hypothetical protein